MYNCMYACMYTCMHACMYVCKYVCMHVCVCLCVCTRALTPRRAQQNAAVPRAEAGEAAAADPGGASPVSQPGLQPQPAGLQPPDRHLLVLAQPHRQRRQQRTPAPPPPPPPPRVGRRRRRCGRRVGRAGLPGVVPLPAARQLRSKSAY